MEKPSEESLPINHMITNTHPAPVPTAETDMTKKKVTTTTKRRTSNFGNSFLKDFRLFIGSGGISKEYNNTRIFNTDWTYSKYARERFHSPITYGNPNPDGSEGEDHFKLKTLIHDYIYENYYLENECKYLVTTELEQKINPFYSYIDGKIPVFFTMDICIIRDNDYQVFDIEIDGPEHYSRGGMMKAEIRDEWLKDRYGVLTMRVDRNDVDCFNYKKLDKFISQPAVENPRGRKKKKYIT